MINILKQGFTLNGDGTQLIPAYVLDLEDGDIFDRR